MFDPSTVLDPMTAELSHAIAKMRKARSLDDRVKWSQIVYHMSASLCGFLEAVSDFIDIDPNEMEGFELSDGPADE